MSEEATSKVDRRVFLKYTVSGVIGLIVGGVAGYLAAPKAAPVGVVTETVTETITKTIRETVTETVTQTVSPPPKAIFGKTEVRLGVIAPLATRQGKVQENAAKLAAEEINAAGGILGLPVKIFVGDTKLDPDTAVSEFRRLVTVEEVVGMTGGFSSGVMFHMMEAMAELKVPFIGDASSPGHNAKVHDEYDKYKYWFRNQNNGATFAFDTGDLLDLLDEKGVDISSIYIIRDEHIWTDDVMKYLQPELEKRGVTIAKDVKIPRGYSEYEPLILEAARMGVQVISPMIAIAGTGDILCKKWAELKQPVLIAGNDISALDLDFHEKTGGAAEGYIFLAHGGVVITAPPTDLCKHFIESYKAKYGYPPEAHQGYGAYDAIYLFKIVMETAYREGKNPFDPDVFVEIMERFNEHNPVILTRRLAWYPHGEERKFDHDVVWGDDFVRNWVSQWQGGKQYIIYGKLKNAEMIFPPWWPK